MTLTTFVWTAVLIGLLISGATSGFATVLTAVVLLPCAAALVAMAFGVRRWIGHLTPSMRRVFRDRESWGAAFNDPHLTKGEILGKVLRYAIAPIYVTLGGLFLLFPVLHWTGDNAANHPSHVVLAPANSDSPLAGVSVDEPPRQQDDESGLFFIGMMMGTFVVVAMGKTRAAQHKNLANPTVEPVPVDWP